MKTNVARSLQWITVLSLLVAAPVAHSQSGLTGEGGDVKQAFLGTWEGFMADSDGSRHGDIKLEITEETITATNPRGGQVMGAGTYKISGGTGKVKRIDAKGTSGQYAGKSYEGVFSIDGKTLKWCSANDNPSSKRPRELKTDVRQGHFLMILEKK